MKMFALSLGLLASSASQLAFASQKDDFSYHYELSPFDRSQCLKVWDLSGSRRLVKLGNCRHLIEQIQYNQWLLDEEKARANQTTEL